MAREAQTPFLIVIEEADHGRLDVFLHKRYPDESRSAIQAAIRAGQILVNQQKVKTGYQLEPGDHIEGALLSVVRNDGPEVLEPYPLPLDILYEDASVLVINKPAGLVVHPGAGTRGQPTLVAAVLAHLSCQVDALPGDRERPGVVHRLDKDTSGVMVMAKDPAAHRSLSQQFKDKTNLREYVALLDGAIQEDECTVDSYLYRDPRLRTRFASMPVEEFEALRESGADTSSYRFARTHFQCRKIYGRRLTLAVMRLETGRTHQIRVHARSLGLPIWGDHIYGYTPRLPGDFAPELRRALESASRHLLHARRLGFIHPADGRKLAFEAPLPPDFRSVLELLEKHSQS